MSAPRVDKVASEDADQGYPRLVVNPPAGTPPVRQRRKLTTVLSADVAGYSTLMASAEEATLEKLKIARRIIHTNIEQHGGREFGVYGDSAMAEFDSPVEALRAALKIQTALAEMSAPFPTRDRLKLRVGIHLDDVMEDSQDLFGDGVNLASRLQSIAEPGGICISGSVYEHTIRKLPLNYISLKTPALKNLGRPVTVYAVSAADVNDTPRKWSLNLSLRYYAFILLGVLALVSAGATALWLQRQGGFSKAHQAIPAVSLRPSVAILPFTAMSQAENESLIARGIADDITIDLQRFSGIQVIGKESVHSIYGEGGLGAVLEKLKPNYTVSGSVTYHKSNIKMNISITDAADNRQVWAQRFEMAGDDWFVAQEKMVQNVIYHLADNVNEQEVARITKKRRVAMNAYELRLKSKEALNDSTPEANENAKAFATQAIEQDPNYVEAYNDLAYAYIRDWQYGWSDHPEASLERARSLADKALSIDPNNYISHWASATAYLNAGDYNRALVDWERAAQLNPQDPDVLASMVDVLVAVGRNEDALARAAEARRIDPKGPSWYEWNAAYTYYMLGRYGDAISTVEGIAEPEDIYRLVLAASYAMRGEPGDDAKAVANIARFRTAMPSYTLDEAARQPFQASESKAHWLSGIRRAFELQEASKQAQP